MVLVKRTSGLGWLALLLCAALVLVSIGASSSHAQSASSIDKSGTPETGDGGTDQGDPDMPTGDAPSPAGGTSSGDGSVYRGHAISGGITEAVPSKRQGQWAHWKIALKLLARSFIIR
jgi:hypothetical protein